MGNTKAGSMPVIMTKKRLKIKMAHTGTNSTKNGKQSPIFIIGGFGDGTKRGQTACGSPWNPGRCKPSKKYKSMRN